MTDDSKKGQTLFRAGMVAIVGRPNVGKSTLLNAIVGQKIAIVSDIPQTTRNQIRGIYNDERAQIVFMDTPGMHSGRDRLDKMMSQTCASSLEGADCIIHLVDPSRRVGTEERTVISKLKNLKTPVILGLNKMDIKKVDIDPYVQLWEEVKGCPIAEINNLTLVALSALNGRNVDTLIDLIIDLLPESPPLYPRDVVTDTPQNIAIADIIREKFLNMMREEIPHSLSVVIEAMEPRKGKTLAIKALILVERETQKEIVIGKKGDVLKTVGTQARQELETLLNTKIFLELFVKVKKDWRDDPQFLLDLGYSN